MDGGIYLIRQGGKLVKMNQADYASEDLLQALLAEYPDLLAGEQMNEAAPRKWILVRREAGVPDEEGGGQRWSVDHLFLDQDAVPTLIEVKRSSDTRIRREVVGQMLDYAANAVVYWPVESIRASFELTCQERKRNPEDVFLEAFGDEYDEAEYWGKVKTNLRAGKIRMVFVADEIPSELRRIVEFLNGQMKYAEVLAVEIKQYVGEGLQTLVPRVIGQTAESEGTLAGPRPTRQWDRTSFLAELENRCTPEEFDVAREIFEWTRTNLPREWYGNGLRSGSYIPALDWRGQGHWILALWTYGRIELQFQHMLFKPPFDSIELREEWLRRLNDTPGVSLPLDALDRRPTVRFEQLVDTVARTKFIEALEWAIGEIRKT